MKIHKTLHSRDDVDRMYVGRKGGGRGLTSIQDSIDAVIQQQNDYLKKHGGKLITGTRNNIDNTSINGTKITRKQLWEEKQLYGYFKWQAKSPTRKLRHG